MAAKDQLNTRFPPEVLARLKDSAKRHGETMTDIVVRGTEAELDRLDGITTPVKPGDRSPLSASEGSNDEHGRADCPHPRARINKGLCGNCGTYVGTTKGGK